MLLANKPELVTDDRIDSSMTDQALKRIGSKLKATRRLKDLTQQEVAAKVGISRTYYSQIENGERDPAVSIMRKIAKSLDVEIADILK